MERKGTPCNGQSDTSNMDRHCAARLLIDATKLSLPPDQWMGTSSIVARLALDRDEGPRQFQISTSSFASDGRL
eukprot:scaffold675082_cov109-Prasinocladus_malaysianus.AAC.1